MTVSLLSLCVLLIIAVKGGERYWLTAQRWHRVNWCHSPAALQWITSVKKWKFICQYLSASHLLSSITHSRSRPVTCCWAWTSQRCSAVWLHSIKWLQVSENRWNVYVGCFFSLFFSRRKPNSWKCVGAGRGYQVWFIYTLPFLCRYWRGQWFGVRPTLFRPPDQVVWVTVLSAFTEPILQATAEPISQSGKIHTHYRKCLKLNP